MSFGAGHRHGLDPARSRPDLSPNQETGGCGPKKTKARKAWDCDLSALAGPLVKSWKDPHLYGNSLELFILLFANTIP